MTQQAVGNRCCYNVYGSARILCSRKAKVSRDGIGYCTQHDPVRREERRLCAEWQEHGAGLRPHPGRAETARNLLV